MAKVYFPDVKRFGRLGYARVSHVPVIFNSQWKYERAFNRYLRERALLLWHPCEDFNPVTRKIDYPGPNTLKNTAHYLKNFLEWCERRGLDWRLATYADILAYQNDMRTGHWSRDGEPLDASTANQRADAATHFLAWAAKRYLRQAFGEIISQSGRMIAGHTPAGRRRAVVEGRPGRIKEPGNKALSRITMIPPATEIREWLAAIKRRKGYAKYLACRFVLETGVRRDELWGILERGLPSLDDLEGLATRGQFTAPMDLYRTKGGRPRTIQIPIQFARELRKWAETKRLTLMWAYKRRTGEPASDALFLSDARGYEGVPISPSTLYETFTSQKPRPKWSPHKGRHAFACFYVLHAMEFEARILGKSAMEMSSGWIIDRGSWWIATLRRQLGHLSEETTDIYLRWLLTSARLAEAACGWHKFLDGE